MKDILPNIIGYLYNRDLIEKQAKQAERKNKEPKIDDQKNK